MAKRKTLQELTIKDNFMFGAVMCNEENCRQLLELILEIPIERVEVSKEKSIIYHPEYKGVRLDVYAKDGIGTHYNVEMQAVTHKALGKRTRYYHSQIDMDLLVSGTEYTELPNAYVIFICDFDPFGLKKYRYTFRNQCLESPTLSLKDGSETVILSTAGTNQDEVTTALIKFLQYVHADLKESTADFEDEFIKNLQKSILDIKQNRRMEERYMLTELLMQEERREGRAEGRIEGKREILLNFLNDLGTIPDALHKQVMQEDDLDQLTAWVKLAARSETLEQFLENI